MANLNIEVWNDENEMVEVTQETFNHVNEMIAKGFLSGEVCQTYDWETGDYYSGWWEVLK